MNKPHEQPLTRPPGHPLPSDGRGLGVRAGLTVQAWFTAAARKPSLPMNPELTRRDLIRGGVAFAALAFVQQPLSLFGFADAEPGAELIPFLDKQSGTNGIKWEELKT